MFFAYVRKIEKALARLACWAAAACAIVLMSSSVGGAVFAQCANSLSTGLAANNGQTGITFEITAQKALKLCQISVASYPAGATGVTLEIWVHPNGLPWPRAASPANFQDGLWVKVGTATGLAMASTGYTAIPVDLSSIGTLAAGQKLGVAVFAPADLGVGYQTGVGGPYIIADANLSFDTQCWALLGSDFTSATASFFPRQFAGSVSYTLAPTNIGNVSATVYNSSTNAPISGATVQITSGASLDTTTTNASGVASFTGIPAGNYKFKVTAPGFVADTGLAATIASGQTTNVGWFLTPLVCSGLLSDGLAANNGYNGITFEITALKPIQLCQISLAGYPVGSTGVTLELWVHPNGLPWPRAASPTNFQDGLWVKVGTATGLNMASTGYTIVPVDLSSIGVLSAQQKLGVAIFAPANVGVGYQTGVGGPYVFSDANLSFDTQCWALLGSDFTSATASFFPRQFVGAVYYASVVVSTGNLSATVYNTTTGAPISGATVQMTSGGSQSATTNASGVASLSGLTAGNYKFTVTAPGFAADTGLSVAIVAGQTTTVGWFLTPGAGVLQQTLAFGSNGVSVSKSGIKYNLPSASGVSIALYDMRGKLVSRFASGMQGAGSYTVNFDRAKLPVGYYFLKFQAGSYTVQRKLALTE